MNYEEAYRIQLKTIEASNIALAQDDKDK